MTEEDTREYPSAFTLELDDIGSSQEEPHTADVVDEDLVRGMHSTAVTSIAKPASLASPTSAGTQIAGPPSYWQERTLQLQQEIAAASSARRGALLLYELGRIYETHLDQHDAALQCYRESHDRFPGLVVNARALGRLLQRAKEYDSCVQILETELSAATSAPERAAVLVERALLRLRFLGDLEGAQSDLSRVLDIEPANAIAIETLTEIHRSSENYGELEQLLRWRLRSCDEPNIRSSLLCEIARLREEFFGDIDDAATSYRTALNAQPGNKRATHALLHAARSRADYPAVARLCEALAEVEPEAAPAYLWEAARIYAGRLRNTELAIGALRRACELTPDLSLLQDFAKLLEREKQWEELGAVLQQAVTVATEPQQKAALAFHLATVQLRRLQQLDEAIDSLLMAIEAAPNHLPARRLLGRLYSRQSRWSDLIDLLSQQREMFVDQSCRAVAFYRIGAVYEHKLENRERAGEYYERALSEHPSYRPAVQGLGRVFAALGRHEDLISVYERELGHCSERSEKALLLWRVAEIWERSLSDPTAAVNAYERLLAVDPHNILGLKALRRIYSAGRSWRELITVLKNEAGQTSDRLRRVALLTEVAEVQERQLDDTDEALQTYLQVLEHAPCHQPALMAAGRLLKRRSDYARLVDLHRRELDYCDDPKRRGWLLMKIARLALEFLGSPEEAIVALNEAVRLDPPPSSAIDQLLWIHRQQRDYGELFEILVRQPVPDAPAAKSLHHRQIAEVLQHSQRPALAVEHLRRALTASDDDAAVQLLERLYVAVEDRQSLVNLYQLAHARSEDPHGRAAAQQKLARLWAAADHDLERAIDVLDKLLEHSPNDRVVLRQLEALLYRAGRWDEAVSVLELIREATDDEDYRRACAVQIAGLREERLDDLTGAAQSAVDVLSGDATDAEALATLERYYRATTNADGLIKVLTRQVSVSQTVAEQAAQMATIAAVHASRGEIDKACEVYRLAVERTPSHLPSILGWQRAARAIGDYKQVAIALEAEAAASRDDLRKTFCDYEAGQTWQSQCGDQERAIAAYRRILEVAPGHQDATIALSNLHAARKEYEELVALLLHAADQQHNNPQTRRDLLARVASIQHRRLNDLLGARRTISKALEIEPESTSLLTTLAEFCRLGEDYRALAQVNRRLSSLTNDSVLLRALHFELGTIWEEHLGSPEEAIREYRRVLELDGNDLPALTRLSTLLLQQQDWLPAAQTTEMLITRDDDRDRVREYHLRLSHIYAKGFSDLPGAIEACRRALALDPGDLRATEQMSALLAEIGDLRALHAHLESTLTVHRARLDDNPFRVSSYRALKRVFGRQNAPDRRFVVCDLMATIGAAHKKDRPFIEELRSSRPLEPKRALTEDELERLLVHPAERGAFRRLLLGAEPMLRKLFAPVDRSIAKPIKVTNRSAPALSPLLRSLNRFMGGGSFNAFLVEGADRDLWVEDTNTPSILISEAFHRRAEDPQSRYRLARVMAHLRLHHTLPSRLEVKGLERLVAALLSVLCTNYNPRLPRAELDPVIEAVEKVLNRRYQATMESAALELADRPLNAKQWMSAMVQSEDRIALAVCGNIQVAIHTLLREEVKGKPRLRRPEDFAKAAGPRLRQLLCFAVSDEYLTLRERLQLAIR